MQRFKEFRPKRRQFTDPVVLRQMREERFGKEFQIGDESIQKLFHTIGETQRQKRLRKKRTKKRKKEIRLKKSEEAEEAEEAKKAEESGDVEAWLAEKARADAETKVEEAWLDEQAERVEAEEEAEEEAEDIAEAEEAEEAEEAGEAETTIRKPRKRKKRTKRGSNPNVILKKVSGERNKLNAKALISLLDNLQNSVKRRVIVSMMKPNMTEDEQHSTLMVQQKLAFNLQQSKLKRLQRKTTPMFRSSLSQTIPRFTEFEKKEQDPLFE